ncbi:hypothetical protein HMPREF9135_1518 [Segatella baroniae F0067]|uniref:Uncharacterized protein n=1 Tax=Segatella baroniae F0067 TaxID=1115809 RepID=U2P3K1_9BACT|nr:hypothetical protein HMPREF9135_1518 [Segatella baroniae F0067]
MRLVRRLVLGRFWLHTGTTAKRSAACQNPSPGRSAIAGRTSRNHVSVGVKRLRCESSPFIS